MRRLLRLVAQRSLTVLCSLRLAASNTRDLPVPAPDLRNPDTACERRNDPRQFDYCHCCSMSPSKLSSKLEAAAETVADLRSSHSARSSQSHRGPRLRTS